MTVCSRVIVRPMMLAAAAALFACREVRYSQPADFAIAPQNAVIAQSIVVPMLGVVRNSDSSVTAADSVQWASASPGIASVDSAGRVTGVAPGVTVIRARFGQLKDSTTVIVTAKKTMGPLRVSKDNPRYFADPSGHAVYLTGSEYWKTVQDNDRSNPPGRFDYSRFLDFLQQHNHNFTRLYMWEQARWTAEESESSWFSPTLYEATGPGVGAYGGPKFDVRRINPAYLDRLRERVQAASARGIYVSIMLFNGWSIEHKGNNDKGSNPWNGHPFNVANNVNGLDGDLNHDGSGAETHSLRVPAITALQDAYVRAVVDAVNDFDNVMFEISNESDQESAQWQYHMIELIHTYESTKPKQHPVGMTTPYPTVPRGSNVEVLSSPADWVSTNGDYRDPVVADGHKVDLSDTDHLCGICGDAAWPWKSFTRGHNTLLMDGYDFSPGVRDSKYNPRDPVWEAIRTNMGYTRTFAARMDLTHAVPRPTLSSTGYCLAVVGKEYLVLIPEGGNAKVDLSGASGSLTLEFFNPADGKSVMGKTVTGGGSVTLSPPFSGMAVAYIHR